MKVLKSVKNIFTSKDKWEPRRCTFPYPEGWCIFNEQRNTSLDHGITEQEAIEICKIENEKLASKSK